jgi:hypothetical protein
VLLIQSDTILPNRPKVSEMSADRRTPISPAADLSYFPCFLTPSRSDFTYVLNDVSRLSQTSQTDIKGIDQAIKIFSATSSDTDFSTCS